MNISINNLNIMWIIVGVIFILIILYFFIFRNEEEVTLTKKSLKQIKQKKKRKEKKPQTPIINEVGKKIEVPLKENKNKNSVSSEEQEEENLLEFIKGKEMKEVVKETKKIEKQSNFYLFISTKMVYS